jgi:hypothetical protein
MADLINRQQAIKAFDDAGFCTHGYIVDVLEQLPSAQPERKGHWVYAGTDYHTGDDWYTCSECEAIDEHYMSPYCWNCGCRMEGDDE